MVAFCMGLHPRLGQHSPVLGGISADVASVVGKFVLQHGRMAWAPAAVLDIVRERRVAKGLPVVLDKHPYRRFM